MPGRWAFLRAQPCPSLMGILQAIEALHPLEAQETFWKPEQEERLPSGRSRRLPPQKEQESLAS